MRLRLLLLCGALLLISPTAFSQMWNQQDTLYGNEWIQAHQPYFKIKIGAEGLYRLPRHVLQAAGIPVDQIAGTHWQVFYLGQEIPIYVSSGAAPLSETHFIEFYGYKNQGMLDQFLFEQPDNAQLNPAYSMFSDTSVYFLTWGSPGKRVTNVHITQHATPPTPIPNIHTCTEYLETSTSNLPPTFGTYSLWGSYKPGEGYGSYRATRYVKTLPLLGLDSTPGIHLRIRLNSWPGNNRVQIWVNTQILKDTLLRGPTVAELHIQLANSSLRNDQIQLEITTSLPSSIAFIKACYTQKIQPTQLLEHPFTFEETPASDAFILNNQPGIVLHPKGNTRRPGSAFAETVAFSAVHLSKTDTLYFIPTQKISAITTLTPFKPLSRSFHAWNYLIIAADPALLEAAQRYANYRASPEGGAFIPGILDLNILEDHFAYGIARHPLAIRNAIHFFLHQQVALRHVFLLGKGLEYPNFRKSKELPAWLIPAFGSPASDNLFVTRPGTTAPHTPIGRLAATTPQHVDDYLLKVQQLEAPISVTPTDYPWTKRILHLAGGQTEAEKQPIREFLDTAAKILETYPLGANIYSFYKNTAEINPLPPNTVGIAPLIDSGVVILTFFGHSSSNTFDFSINEPQHFQNTGKYPTVLALGCSAGQIFSPYRSLSEAFIFEPARGAAAFIGTSTTGDLFALGALLQEIYQHFNTLPHPRLVGEALRDAYRAFSTRVSVFERALIQTTILHGDPALRLPFSPGPDFTFDSTSIRQSPALIHIHTDTLTVAATLRNVGQAIPDSLDLELSLVHTSTKQAYTYRIAVLAPKNQETIQFSVPVQGVLQAGTYQITIQIDPYQHILEWPTPQAKQNNILSFSASLSAFEIHIFETTAAPVFPPPYGVVRKQPLELIATLSNPLDLQPLSYRFEIDTTDTFNSPVLACGFVRNTAGLLRWQPTISLIPGQTYFWRVGPDARDTASLTYAMRSFTYTPSVQADWMMGHFAQFDDCLFFQLQPNHRDRQFQFQAQSIILHALSGRYPDIVRPEIAVNYTPSRFFPFNTPRFDAGVYVAVFDGQHATPWKNQLGGLYGSQLQSVYHPAIADFIAFPFPSTSIAARARLMDFLAYSVPSGHYILLLTVSDGGQSLQAEDWVQDTLADGRSLIELLEKQGAKVIRRLSETPFAPYYFFYKKDDPSFPVSEALGDPEASISQSWTLPSLHNSGRLRTPHIGPSLRWDSLHWQVQPTPYSTEAVLHVWGIDTTGQQYLLLENSMPGDIALRNLDAKRFPFLQLEYQTTDSFSLKPAQPAFWAVQYTAYPDYTLSFSRNKLKPTDTIVQSQPYPIELEIHNLGPPCPGLLSVECTVFQPGTPPYHVLEWIPAPDTNIQVAFNIPTTHLSGTVPIRVELHASQQCPESNIENNQGELVLHVQTDRIPPELDVTFDGQPHASGTLLGGKPTIVATLRDNQPYPLLNDTSVLEFFLRPPTSSIFRKLRYPHELTFHPASPNHTYNEARVEFRPEFTKSGIYTLLVQAKDMVGNICPPYAASFEIIDKQRLLHWASYPNPFSDLTRFGYYLSGLQAPEHYTVYIFSQSGLLVRTLRESDLGPLRIGRHLTDFGWDGRNDAGTLLSSGIYFCQLIFRQADQEVQSGLFKIALFR